MFGRGVKGEEKDIPYELVLRRNAGQGYHGYHRHVVGREACEFFKDRKKIHRRFGNNKPLPEDTTIADFYSKPFVYVYNAADTSHVYKEVVDNIRKEYEQYLYSKLPLVPDMRVTQMMLREKIMAVLLTILSTVLGLIPFFIDGKEEPFWFSFAVGSAGGLLFSVFAVVFVMPILMKLSDGKKISWYDLNHGKRVSRQTFRLIIPIFFTVTKKQGESKAVVFLNTTYCVNLWHETEGMASLANCPWCCR